MSAIDWAERGWLPDGAVRLLRAPLRELAQAGGERLAVEPHCEASPALFAAGLGPRLEYSSRFLPQPHTMSTHSRTTACGRSWTGGSASRAPGISTWPTARARSLSA